MSEQDPSKPELSLQELAALLDDDVFENFYFDMVAAARCSVRGAEERLLHHARIICSQHGKELPAQLGQWLVDRLPGKRRGRKRDELTWRRDLRLARLMQDNLAAGMGRSQAAEAARQQLWDQVLEALASSIAIGEPEDNVVLQATSILGPKMQKEVRSRIQAGTPGEKALDDLRKLVNSGDISWVDNDYVARQRKKIFEPPASE